MSTLLDGVRVIDFGHYIAGPMAAMLLADQGADVVKVERPGTPVRRTPPEQVWNRGKRGIVLDLRSDEDRSTALELIDSADVVVENFRPHVMGALGLGWRTASERNPQLIYCSIPGFGSDDPRAGVQAWEGVVGAATGLYGRPGRPVYGEVPTSSLFGALLGALSVAAALHARTRGGTGQHIEVPLYDATFHAQLVTLLHAGTRDPAGTHAGVMDQFWPLARAHAMRGQYECSDGRFIDMTVHSARTFEAFVDAAGVRSWLDEGLITAAMAPVPGRESELVDRVRSVLSSRPADVWDAELGGRGVAVAPVLSPREWLHSDQARIAGAAVMVEDTEFGPMTQPGPLVRVGTDIPAVRAAPRPDEHRAEVLADADKRGSRSTSEVGGRGAVAGPPLSGVNVLDMSLLLAGPSACCLLAEFGADVIKINEPTGFHGGRGGFSDRDRGKKSITVDLKTPEGKEIFWRLSERADAIVQNWRPGVAERMGLGYEQVHERFPHIVYASDCAFGETGPRRERGGYEYQAQAIAGLEHRYAGGKGAIVQPVPVVDLGTGIGLALAVTLGLMHRQRTGEGLSVYTALAFTATLAGSAFLYDYDGRPWDEGQGQQMLGSGPFHRAYETGDGWIFLGASEDDRDALVKALELGGDDIGDPLSLTTAFQREFLSGSAEEWVVRLVDAGVGAHRVLTGSDLVNDPIARHRDLVWPTEIANLGPTMTAGVAPRLSRTPLLRHLSPPVPGQDAREVLESVGMEDELDDLVRRGIIVIDTTGPFSF